MQVLLLVELGHCQLLELFAWKVVVMDLYTTRVLYMIPVLFEFFLQLVKLKLPCSVLFKNSLLTLLSEEIGLYTLLYDLRLLDQYLDLDHILLSDLHSYPPLNPYHRPCPQFLYQFDLIEPGVCTISWYEATNDILQRNFRLEAQLIQFATINFDQLLILETRKLL